MTDVVKTWLLNRGKPMYVSVADVPALLEKGFLRWPYKDPPKETYYPQLDQHLNTLAAAAVEQESSADEVLSAIIIE